MQTVEKKYTAAILKDIATMRKAVKRGAKLLDKKGPKDWDKTIKKGLLDLSDPNSCILGQAFKDIFEPTGSLDTPFDGGVRGLGITINQVEEYGFDASYLGCSIEDPHDLLTDIWLQELKERAASRKAASI